MYQGGDNHLNIMQKMRFVGTIGNLSLSHIFVKLSHYLKISLIQFNKMTINYIYMNPLRG